MPSSQRQGPILVVLVVLFLGLMVPRGEAEAAFVQLGFDFTGGSSLSLLGGTIVTPPDGTFDTGSATLQVEASDISTPIPGGDVVLKQTDFAGTVSKNVLGAADISGPYSGSQVGTLSGTLAAGGTGADFTEDMFLDLNITLGCIGLGCDPLGFPVNVVGVNALSFSFLSITDLDSVGNATILLTTPVELDGVFGVLTLVGQETSRQFVPEPATGSLLLLGLAWLGRTRTRVRQGS